MSKGWEENELENPAGNMTWVYNTINRELTVHESIEKEEKEYAPWDSFLVGMWSVCFTNGVKFIDRNDLFEYTSTTPVIIPTSVTSIRAHAFNISKIQRIKIPHTVLSIDGNPFVHCAHLLEIDVDERNPNYTAVDGVLFNKDITSLISCPGLVDKDYSCPQTVTAIGKEAFCGCKRLRNVLIPDSVTSIGEGCFSSCQNLLSVIVSKNVTEIKDRTFFDCVALMDLFIPDSVTRIGSHAFEHCEILNIEILPTQLKSIGDHAFAHMRYLEFIAIPDGVTSIEEGTFQGCIELNMCPLTPSIISLGANAFSECREIKKIIIQKSLSSISGNPFPKCLGVTSFEVEEGNTEFVTVDGVLFNRDMTRLISYPGGKRGDAYVIPEGVIAMEDRAFDGCKQLYHVTIPSTMTSISDHLFSDCINLVEITIPEGIVSIGTSAFWGCNTLFSINLPSSVTVIGPRAFYSCRCLKEATVPSHAIGIPEAFTPRTRITTY